MISKILNICRKYLLYVIITTVIIFISITIIGYIKIDNVFYQNNAAIFGEAEKVLSIGLVGSIVTIFLLAGYLAYTVHDPLKMLSKKLKIMSEKDIVSFSSALVEMAQGNLTTGIKLDTSPLKTSVNGQVGEMVRGLNAIIENMTEASKEFNAATEKPCQRLCLYWCRFLPGRTCLR